MNIILFDDSSREDLLPLTFTRPIADLRIGIMKISEKWGKLFKARISYHTDNYLKIKYSTVVQLENTLINGSILPNEKLFQEIKNLKKGTALVKNGILLAIIVSGEKLKTFDFKDITKHKQIESESEIAKINYPWDIFLQNGKEIENDFKILTKGRESSPISKTNNILQPERIFFEPGAKAEFVTLNPADGYIYVGKDAEIMEGSIVRGSLALCEHSALKLGAKIYGPTTIGPFSKVGGEVNNSVIHGYSNKGHDGFLGNSVLGEWCNIGADSNNSNLKNNYEEVKIWNYKQNKFIKTGLQFCGLIMGDHSKCGINTMFNTGTVVGVSSNIFGAGFPRNFVPSFTWGGATGFVTYELHKAFETAKKVMERREINFDKTEQDILNHIYSNTIELRNLIK